MPLKKKPPKLKRLTSRIFEENEIVNREHWKLNTIVMNASDDCSVDSVTYGTVLKVRLRELMKHIKYLSQWKKATAVGSPKLSARLICGLGFRHAKDLQSLLEIVFEMKSCCNLILDRSTFTAMVDALLYSGSIKVVGLYALCIFGEIVKRVCSNPGLWPKPHLYVSMMHELAARVDYDIVKSPYRRMWPDSTGTISPEVQEEAGHLLMEAALNDGQAAIRIEALLGLMKSMFSPYLLPQDHPIERIMMPVEEARPLPGTIALRKVVMRLFRDPVVPIVDDYCCTVKPAVRSIGHVIDLILAKRHKMVVVVKCGNL
ncbi:hypothetical protein CUMW_082300 [Citrus unshiu]|nr:hypothetical protein CUMW_082300 [Citrus unshiu]